MPTPSAKPPHRDAHAPPSRHAGRVGLQTALGAPYSITRHFSVTSLIGILVVLGALLLLYRYIAFNALKDHETRNNVAITQVFANTLWPAHADYLQNAAALPRETLATRPEAAAIRQDVLRQMKGLNVVKVKIYDVFGTTIFSTDPKQIGEDKSTNAGFLRAAGGGVASEITFRDRFDAFEQVINDRSLVYSYIPLRKGDSARVEAVMEVYSDVTDFVTQLEATQWQIVGAVLGALALLYLLLYALARRADRIIAAQREEMRAAHQATLAHQANHDALTGLPNRASFAERLDTMIKAARRGQSKVAVLCVHVHGLKGVNESLGQLTGDRLIGAMAHRFTDCLREADITARLGGAEFAAALTGVNGVEQVAGVAEKIQRIMTAATYTIDGHDLAVKVSIGIGIHPEDGADAPELLTSADAAMHHAAAGGDNRYQFHAPEMNTRALAMLLLEQDLRRALERGELLLHYQPQLDINTGRVVGLEALVRWQHPERGLVPPLEFIPLAEERGLIDSLGRWVLREACRQNKAWQSAGFPPLPVSVNLSAHQLQQRDLAQAVANTLAECGLDARYLELELTESAVVRDPARAIETMRALRAIGVRISLDDFGTGYSSLSQLKLLPLDKLKIDQGFVQGLPGDRCDLAISRAIIGIGKAMNLTVIAEGVETAAQVGALEGIECTAVQGYYVSRPLAAGACAAFMQQNLEMA